MYSRPFASYSTVVHALRQAIESNDVQTVIVGRSDIEDLYMFTRDWSLETPSTALNAGLHGGVQEYVKRGIEPPRGRVALLLGRPLCYLGDNRWEWQVRAG